MEGVQKCIFPFIGEKVSLLPIAHISLHRAYNGTPMVPSHSWHFTSTKIIPTTNSKQRKWDLAACCIIIFFSFKEKDKAVVNNQPFLKCQQGFWFLALCLQNIQICFMANNFSPKFHFFVHPFCFSLINITNWERIWWLTDWWKYHVNHRQLCQARWM